MIGCMVAHQEPQQQSFQTSIRRQQRTNVQAAKIACGVFAMLAAVFLLAGTVSVRASDWTSGCKANRTTIYGEKTGRACAAMTVGKSAIGKVRLSYKIWDFEDEVQQQIQFDFKVAEELPMDAKILVHIIGGRKWTVRSSILKGKDSEQYVVFAANNSITQQLKSGRAVSLIINGRPIARFSLKGSSDAISEVYRAYHDPETFLASPQKPNFSPKQNSDNAAATNQTPTAKIALASLVGAPDYASKTFRSSLNRPSKERRLVVVDATQEDGADYKLQGYFVAEAVGETAKISYIFDVMNPSGERVHRITGEKFAKDNHYSDPWLAVPPMMMEEIAADVTQAMQDWLKKTD